MKRVSGRVRVGIIGAGLIGQTHSRMLRDCADRSDGAVRVVSIADTDLARAQNLAARWPESRPHANWRQVIEDAGIDAVFICTPTALHREPFLAAVRAGKHVFCEKPLAMTAAEALEMERAAHEAAIAAQVGLVLRFSPVYTVIKALTAERSAGKLLAITLRDDQDFPIRGGHASPWRNDPAFTAGGTLVEHSVHDFDLLTWMFGPARRLYCRTRNLNGAPNVEDFGATDLEFEAGFHAQLTSVWHRMIARISNRRMEVLCENLYIACDYDTTGPIVVQRGNEAREETIPETEVMRRFEDIILAERPYLSALRDRLAIPYALEDATFVAALRGECEIYPAISAGVAAQRMVEAAYDSARRGIPVDLTG